MFEHSHGLFSFPLWVFDECRTRGLDLARCFHKAPLAVKYRYLIYISQEAARVLLFGVTEHAHCGTSWIEQVFLGRGPSASI